MMAIVATGGIVLTVVIVTVGVACVYLRIKRLVGHAGVIEVAVVVVQSDLQRCKLHKLLQCRHYMPIYTRCQKIAVENVNQ